MKKDDQVKPSLLAVATTLAAVLVFLYGLGYRILAKQLTAPVHTAPMTQATLAQLPLQISNWRGRDLELNEDLIRATDTDAHVSRQYSRHGTLESVWLWIASGVRARDLMPHRPEVCYTGNGWTVRERKVVELPLDDDGELSCNVYLFSRGGFHTERILVLYYYLVDGVYCQDVSLLRSQAWRGSGTVNYVAQVQVVINVPSIMTVDSAQKTAMDFARDSAAMIVGLFKERMSDTDSAGEE